jgi:hypothetical protein
MYTTAMPAYLFTFHSYRSWNADHRRGFVQVDRGIQPPNAALARFYDQSAKQSPALFDANQQRVIVWIAWDSCNNRTWRLHAAAFEPTHAHILVSWQSSDTWQVVRGKLKNLIGWALSKELGHDGRRWMVRGASRKRVRDRNHFDYLMKTYLPRHGGIFWKEGDSRPTPPDWAMAKIVTSEPRASAGGYSQA